MEKIIIIGFEYNNYWKAAHIYSKEVGGSLEEADDWNEATVYTSIEEAEKKKQCLQSKYGDYTWYILKLNE
jgi:predicted transcriptional regulator